MPNIKSDIQLAEYLIDKAEVAVVPGSAFGQEGHIRISFATNKEILSEAMNRIEKAVTL